jgi:23S rRNA (pseudouridine1915-N3)-methyltransferase
MKIEILCIGSLKEQYLRDAEAEYLKRLSRFAKVEITEVKEARTIEAEGAALLAKLGIIVNRNARYVIALDVRGKSLSSEAFAERVAELGLSGKSAITFIIGGSCGLSEEVLKSADLRLSFSAMTFPHQLMRVILLEQIYRSFKINSGEIYHK